MAIQYAHAHPGKEFKPTKLGIDEYWMDARFRSHPEYRERLPKRWLTNGWVCECRVAIIKGGNR